MKSAREHLEDRDMEFSIVSGSSEEMLFACLESLERTMKGSSWSWTAVVTCNEPGNGLAGRVRSRFPQARVIENPTPKGFAANHNSVLTASRARYVWLLNDDLLILPGAIDKVTRFLERPENARAGVVSPKLLNPDGSLQPSTYGFPSMPQILVAHSGLREFPLTDSIMRHLGPRLRSREGSSRFWAHDRTVAVDTLRGACVAMRMKAVRQVGPMVEVAMVGGEETEWHRRFKEHNWKVVYYAEASVIHYGSQTVRDGSRNHYPEYLKGALYFFRTGRPAATYKAFCAALVAMFGARLAFQLLKRDKSGAGVARRYARVAWDGLLGR
ncbi:MAG: glycosyltransferase [Gemmatimonadales bacterium]